MPSKRNRKKDPHPEDPVNMPVTTGVNNATIADDDPDYEQATTKDAYDLESETDESSKHNNDEDSVEQTDVTKSTNTNMANIAPVFEKMFEKLHSMEEKSKGNQLEILKFQEKN